MNAFRNFLLIACATALSLFAASCGDQADNAPMTEVRTENFVINIPVWLRPSKINEDAKVCYSHLLKDVVVIVIEEDKQEFFDTLIEYDLNYSLDIAGYAALLLESIESEVVKCDTIYNPQGDVEKVSKYELVDGNGIVVAKRSVYVQDSENLYQVIVIFKEAEANIYNDMADRIFKSFRLTAH